jgi:phosphate starvation-inducible protein PhoH
MIKAYHYILLMSVLALAGGLYFVLHQNKHDATKRNEQKEDVQAVQVIQIQKDSMIQLLSAAYGSLIQIGTEGNNLRVSTQSANAKSMDLINGNTALITANKEHGFSIKQDNVNSGITAEFAVKNNFVTMPTDVVFAAMQKKYALTNSKPTK